jgi:hypothetical protein
VERAWRRSNAVARIESRSIKFDQVQLGESSRVLGDEIVASLPHRLHQHFAPEVSVEVTTSVWREFCQAMRASIRARIGEFSQR